MKYFGTYIGTVTAVHPPSSNLNVSRYQYEYAVNVTVEGFAQIPVRGCVQVDRDGSFDNFEHNILLPGSCVLMIFPNGNISAGIIMGAIRNYKGTMPTISGSQQTWMKRYNKFQLSIDNNYNFWAQSDSGPYASVQTSQVVLDDSAGENLTLNKDTNTTTLNTKEFVTNVADSSQTTVANNATVTIGQNGTLTVNGNVTMTVQGNVSLTVQGNLQAQVTGNATIQAATIKLNGGAGNVLTTETMDVVDSIYGEPSIGVPTVFSGS